MSYALTVGVLTRSACQSLAWRSKPGILPSVDYYRKKLSGSKSLIVFITRVFGIPSAGGGLSLLLPFDVFGLRNFTFTSDPFNFVLGMVDRFLFLLFLSSQSRACCPFGTWDGSS